MFDIIVAMNADAANLRQWVQIRINLHGALVLAATLAVILVFDVADVVQRVADERGLFV